MSFDVSALAAYTEQNADKLIAATILTPETAKLIEANGVVLAGVKSSEQIGQMETDATFQTGACGFSPSASTVFSKRVLTVGDIKIEESLCYKDLEAKYTQKMLTAGATYENPEDFNFYEFWVNRKVAQAANAIEKALWQGDTASGDGQLNKFDGFIKLIVNATDEIDANDGTHGLAQVTVAGGGITQTNVISVLQAIINATPLEVKQQADFRVFCGHDIIELANLKIYADNKFHYDTTDPNSITIPGTQYKAVAVNGLNGTQKLFGMRMSNMYLGTDLLSDQTSVQVWYEKKDNAIDYRNAFKLGVQVGITKQCVKFIPA